MALEFEKLTPDLEKMALTAAQQQVQRRQRVEVSLQTLRQFAVEWQMIEVRLLLAHQRADPKYYRAARPLNQDEGLNAAINFPTPPDNATIFAADGSQIMPDRHAAFLYYLINVGGIIYYHGDDGDGRPPGIFSEPEITYLGDEQEEDGLISSGVVSVLRDLQEIGMLSATIAAYKEETAPPLLGLVDQRLLYWPIGGPEGSGNKAVEEWLIEMTAIRRCGALLAGYIDRPGKAAVVTLLQALAADLNDFETWRSLGRRGAGLGLSDAALFSQVLQPGQRSAVFVDISPANERFAEYDPANQVCFFYLNPGRHGNQIARVDIPMWVAERPEQVAAVHALIYDQCQILGDYPYVLARADEMAVVGHQEHEELNFMIELFMQRQGIESAMTAKQHSKEIARGGKTRHGV
jgi:hypothetical protein